MRFECSIKYILKLIILHPPIQCVRTCVLAYVWLRARLATRLGGCLALHASLNQQCQGVGTVSDHQTHTETTATGEFPTGYW